VTTSDPPPSRPVTDPRTRALRLLARREHSARQLRTKLTRRGAGEEPADEALDGGLDELLATLERQGLQSDARFAELLVRSRLSQHYGPLRIAAELRLAGVEASLIAAAIEAADADWDTGAAAALRKRFGNAGTRRAEQARQFRYLLGRGFEAETLRRLLGGGDD
jgi:regulatory protein